MAFDQVNTSTIQEVIDGLELNQSNALKSYQQEYCKWDKNFTKNIQCENGGEVINCADDFL